MHFSVHHQTTYRYLSEVELLPHKLILFPRGSYELTTISKSLIILPEASLNWSQDVFGNLIVTASFAEKTRELVITSDLLVEQIASAWPIFSIATRAHSFPFSYVADEVTDLGELMKPSGWDTTVTEWVEAFIRSSPTDTLSLLKDVNAGILDTVAYRVRDEEGTQSAAETLDLRSGSCRDIAMLFIEGVRHLGFGARAVSGYLADATLAADDPGSTHAWAEVYLPGAGWIAFDPTHKSVGSSHLIPVATARQNQQIMPISGAYLGAHDAFAGMDVTVTVAPVSGAGA